MKKLSDKERKDKLLSVRLTAAQVRELTAAANELGMSLSSWAKSWLMYGCERNVRGKLVHPL